MSGCGPDMRAEGVLCKGPHRSAVGKESGLCITSQRQLVSRALEAESTQVCAERWIDFATNSAGEWESGSEIFSQSRLLRALAGKE